jgi:predicted RNA-binding protein with PUA-like domain
MKQGDQVFFYHSNIGLEIVGIATISSQGSPIRPIPKASGRRSSSSRSRS